MFHIVLVEPEIPQNTGNIVRTCAATGCQLHLVEPLGFSIQDKYLKRAGLDYWDKAFVGLYQDFNELLGRYPDAPFFLVETTGSKLYTDVAYPKDAFFVFGSETKGLSQELCQAFQDRLVRLPMRQGLRSLNLSNAVAVFLYEALRQHGFEGLG